MLGITIRASRPAGPFWQLVDRASTFEHEPSVRKLGYAPHLTLARYGDVDSSLLKSALAVFDDVQSFSLVFDHIGTFDTDPLILWLAPRHDVRLFDLHARVHAIVGERHSDPDYRPGAWQPHLTIASAVRPESRSAARAFADEPIEPMTMVFDRADAAEWPPLTLIGSRELS